MAAGCAPTWPQSACRSLAFFTARFGERAQTKADLLKAEVEATMDFAAAESPGETSVSQEAHEAALLSAAEAVQADMQAAIQKQVAEAEARCSAQLTQVQEEARAKVAAAEGVDAAELQKTMRGGNKRDVLLEILLDLLPPETEPEPEPEGGEGGEASVAPVSLTWRLPAVSLLTRCA